MSYDPNLDIADVLIEIEEDRYRGSYSGATFTAWHGFRPDDIDAGDATCEEFWGQNRGVTHGRGSTPQEAYRDLIEKCDFSSFELEQICFVSVNLYHPGHIGFLRKSDVFKAWLEAA